jgi:hypothetical protein
METYFKEGVRVTQQLAHVNNCEGDLLLREGVAVILTLLLIFAQHPS